MRFLSVILITLFSLIVEVTGNNESISSEVLFFYYVYRMQYISGKPVTIAKGCIPKGETRGTCYFDEFVRYVIEDTFVQQYRPKPEDHTRNPTSDNLVTFQKVVTEKSKKYITEHLDSNLESATDRDIEERGRAQAALFMSILTAANDALDSGRALVSDAEMAQDAAQLAIYKRGDQAKGAIKGWLESKFTKPEQNLVHRTFEIPDWDITLDNIDHDNDVNEQQKDTLKQKLRDASGRFGQPYAGAPRSDIMHLSIIRSLQSAVTQIGEGLKRATSAGEDILVPSRDSLTRCPPDYSSSSSNDSDFKKREQGGFVAKIIRIAKAQPRALARFREIRGLQPISLSTSGATVASSTSSSVYSSSTTSPASSSTIATSSTASTTTNTGYDMAITTIFSDPAECTGDLTTMATDTGNLWLNVIDPVPKVTMTKCSLSQFIASALATTTLPPFSKIVCPDGWESYSVNSTSVICCPNGFTLYAPHYTDTARPGRNAICSSVVWPSVLMDVTSYDASSLVTVLPETACANGSIVYATAFDGNTVVPVTPVSLLSQTIISSITLPPSPTPTPTSTKTVTTTSSVLSNPFSTLSTVSKTSSVIKTSTITMATLTSKTSITSTILPVISSLPSCGPTCVNNMLSQYADLGCSSADPACVCRNDNFGYGVRDCSNGACGTPIGSSVIAWASTYCSTPATLEFYKTEQYTFFSQYYQLSPSCSHLTSGIFSTQLSWVYIPNLT